MKSNLGMCVYVQAKVCQHEPVFDRRDILLVGWNNLGMGGGKLRTCEKSALYARKLFVCYVFIVIDYNKVAYIQNG
jgi:hypothetical protein